MCGWEQCADAADVEEKWTATGPREAQKGWWRVTDSHISVAVEHELSVT